MVKQILPAEWKNMKLVHIAKKCTAKNRDFTYHLVLTNSAQRGIVYQTEHFDKSIAVEDNIDGYFVVSDGDFVYNPRISATAPCGPIRRNHLGKTGVMSPLYTVFRLKEGTINDAYIEFYFLSSAWYRYMKSIANYGVRHDRMAITDDDFFSMPIPIPPLMEQCAIVEILTTVDRLIALKKRLITTKRKQKRWLMQNLLTGKISLPRFNGKWKSARLGDIYDIYSGQTPSRENPQNYENATTAWVKTTDLNNSEIVLNGENISSKAAKKLKTLPIGTVLIAMYGGLNQIGRTGMLTYPATINQALSALPPVSEVNPYFLIEKLNLSVGYWRRIAASSRKDPNINKDDVSSFELHYPPLPEQQAIAEILTVADCEIALLSTELEQQRQVKKYLMQQLLTGRIRTDGVNV